MMERPWCRFRREARARERRRLPQVVDSLKVLDPNRPFREADMQQMPLSKSVPACTMGLTSLRGDMSPGDLIGDVRSASNQGRVAITAAVTSLAAILLL